MRKIVGVDFFLYRVLVGPALVAFGGLGHGCRYTPSCSEYSRQAFLEFGFFRALRLTLWRILRCNPWISAAHFDPLPRSSLG